MSDRITMDAMVMNHLKKYPFSRDLPANKFFMHFSINNLNNKGQVIPEYFRSILQALLNDDSFDDLHLLETVVRTRREVQNTLGLYPATNKTQEIRKSDSEEYRIHYGHSHKDINERYIRASAMTENNNETSTTIADVYSRPLSELKEIQLKATISDIIKDFVTIRKTGEQKQISRLILSDDGDQTTSFTIWEDFEKYRIGQIITLNHAFVSENGKYRNLRCANQNIELTD